ncbi:MAG: TRAP transporter small permease subunit [Pseudomonadota bacterium]
MDRVLSVVEAANRRLGRGVAWAALVMMLAQAFSVVARYVFSDGVIAVQEAVVYGHAFLFLGGSAYVLQLNEHVRVDVFYGGFGSRLRRAVDLIALAIFVLPVVAVILWVSAPYILRAWESLEGSRQAGGIPGVFLLKTAIGVFAISVGLQAAATFLRIVRRQQAEGWTNRRSGSA